jgi:uncharacterized membrane-anchored protein
MEVERRVSRYVMPPQVLRAELEGQEVLLNPETGVYHLVNETGRELLDGLRDGLTLEEAAQRMAEHKRIPAGQAISDATRFVAEMAERGLLAETSE